MNIAVFASGRGSNFEAIHSKIISGEINAKIGCLISNNASAGAIDFATLNNISTYSIDVKSTSSTLMLLEILEKHEIQLIVLAGYMKLIPVEIVERYENKIINIHPALLPSFGGKGCFGMNVHRKVWKSGVKFTGATVHFINNKYDEGNIIAQEIVPVLHTDSPEDIAKRVLKIEHQLLPKIVRQICEDQLIWKNNKPWIKTF